MYKKIMACSIAFLIIWPSAGLLHAHKIHMKDGSVIKTKSCWEENGIVKYERYGGYLSIKKDLVKEIEYEEEEEEAEQPNVSASLSRDQDDLRKRRTEPLSAEEVFRLCKPAVVVIKCGDGEGSGFFINSEGLILTNHHVVRSGSRVLVHLPSGEEHVARVMAKTNRPDMALLKIPRMPTPYLALEKGTDNPDRMIGKEVFAIGNPAGFQFSITRGIISQIRDIDKVKYIQTDTSINPGNSGGPLINTLGNVVGMNTFKRRSTDLNFAIALDVMSGWVDEYLRHGRVSESDPGPEPETRAGREADEGGGGVIIIPIPLPIW